MEEPPAMPSVPPQNQPSDSRIAVAPSPAKKGHRKLWIALGIVAVLVVIGLIFYPWVKSQLFVAALRGEFTVAKYPQLAIVPTPLNLSSVNTSSSQTFSYFGASFGVPWTETPNIITSKDGSAVQLKFPNGQFITILQGSSYANTASGIAQTSGLSNSEIQSVYGQDLNSDYSFLSAVLNSTPSETSTAETILSSLKYPFFGFVGADGKPLAIYSFSLPTTQGFELVGQFTASGQDHQAGEQDRINFLFDEQGKGAHDFVIGSTTQDEANSILASIKLTQ